MALVETARSAGALRDTAGGVVTSSGLSLVDNSDRTRRQIETVTFDRQLQPEIQPETKSQTETKSQPADDDSSKTPGEVAQLSRRAIYGTMAVVAVLLALLFREG